MASVMQVLFFVVAINDENPRHRICSAIQQRMWCRCENVYTCAYSISFTSLSYTIRSAYSAYYHFL